MASVALAVAFLVLTACPSSARDVLGCLLYRGDGCQSIKDKQSCLASRDGSRWNEFQGIPIHGQRCVWCGGVPCTDMHAGLCDSYEFVQRHRGQGGSDRPLEAQTSVAASCRQEDGSLPSLAVLPSEPLAEDLVQVDGRDRSCRGAHPLDTGAIPAPVPGQGKELAFSVWTAASLAACGALCKEGCFGVEYRAADAYCEVWHRPIQFTAASPGFQCLVKRSQQQLSWLSAMTSVDTSCLSVREAGCAAVLDETSCLSSVQSSGPTRQQCVWCGGGLCSSDRPRLCQPLSALLVRSPHQQPAASFKVAGCAAGKAVGLPPPLLPPAAFTHLAAPPRPAVSVSAVASAPAETTTELPPLDLPEVFSPMFPETSPVDPMSGLRAAPAARLVPREPADGSVLVDGQSKGRGPDAGAGGAPWWVWALLAVLGSLCLAPCMAYALGCWEERQRSKRSLNKRPAPTSTAEGELEAAPLESQAPAQAPSAQAAQVPSRPQLSPVQRPVPAPCPASFHRPSTFRQFVLRQHGSYSQVPSIQAVHSQWNVAIPAAALATSSSPAPV